jgi:hypothetical protein
VSTPSYEVADVFRNYSDAFRKQHGTLPRKHERVIKAMTQCRTEQLGGHLYACDQCGVIAERFNSCRNRHCPKCQNLERARWLEKRQGELLPVPYFHVVFTLPHKLNPLVIRNERALYTLLFRTAADTLAKIAADPRHLGAKIGFVAVLHTWGQKLQLHPHIHAIVPGGGIAPDGDRWISGREDFFLPVRVLGALFRGKFLAGVKELVRRHDLTFPDELSPEFSPGAFRAWLDALYATPWVVYAKPPFGGPEEVLRYVARYTHRVAISNNRLLDIDGGRVVFRYKDYADGARKKQTSLEADEFMRRFLMHVLPDRFHRIRSYGLLANRNRRDNLERCRTLLGVQANETADAEAADGGKPQETWQEQMRRLTGIDPTRCQVCGKGVLVLVEVLAPPRRGVGNSRAPPT